MTNFYIRSTPALDGLNNQRVENINNSPKPSIKYLDEKICKIKQIYKILHF